MDVTGISDALPAPGPAGLPGLQRPEPGSTGQIDMNRTATPRVSTSVELVRLSTSPRERGGTRR
ncbi:hypothetical protein FMEAI12_3280002 [Parafrankia sp. Ea1.12]|nr:hypothetical protein FMEAI12_3280002 [Parafrankia sp. Ea1.12]